VCCCGCAFLKWKSKSSRWFGKGATSSIVTADVDIPDKVLRSGSIWQKCERRGRKGISVAGLSGHQEQEQEQEQEQRDEVGEAYRRRFWVCCWYLRSVVKVSEGSSAASLLELSGTMKWSYSSLSLDWEVLSVMVASVDQYKTFGLRCVRAERRTFSYPLLKNGCCVGKVRRNLPTVPVRG
jgi:hypothetical protein